MRASYAFLYERVPRYHNTLYKNIKTAMRFEQLMRVLGQVNQDKLASVLRSRCHGGPYDSVEEMLHYFVDMSNYERLRSHNLDMVYSIVKDVSLQACETLKKIDAESRLMAQILRKDLLDPEVYRAMNHCAASSGYPLIKQRKESPVFSWVSEIPITTELSNLGAYIGTDSSAAAQLIRERYGSSSSMREFLEIPLDSKRKIINSDREESQSKFRKTENYSTASTNAMAELAQLMGKQELQLKTMFNQPRFKRLIKKHLSDFVTDSLPLADLLKNLSPVWAHLFKLFHDISERKLNNRLNLVSRLTETFEKLRQESDFAELLCWDGKTRQDRLAYVEQNFFSFMDVSNFLELVGEDPQTASIIDPDHLRELYRNFIAVLDGKDTSDSMIAKDFRSLLLEQRVDVILKLMKKSQRSAPLDKLEEALKVVKKPTGPAVVVSLVKPAEENSVEQCVEEVKTQCSLSDEACTKLTETVKTWVDNKLAKHSTKAEFITSLKETLTYSNDDISKKTTASILLVKKLATAGIIKFKVK